MNQSLHLFSILIMTLSVSGIASAEPLKVGNQIICEANVELVNTRNLEIYPYFPKQRSHFVKFQRCGEPVVDGGPDVCVDAIKTINNFSGGSFNIQLNAAVTFGFFDIAQFNDGVISYSHPSRGHLKAVFKGIETSTVPSVLDYRAAHYKKKPINLGILKEPFKMLFDATPEITAENPGVTEVIMTCHFDRTNFTAGIGRWEASGKATSPGLTEVCTTYGTSEAEAYTNLVHFCQARAAGSQCFFSGQQFNPFQAIDAGPAMGCVKYNFLK